MSTVMREFRPAEKGHPAGVVELDDPDLEVYAGGTHPTITITATLFTPTPVNGSCPFFGTLGCC